jgi:nucleotide-binding universal stress UspA family protein
MVLFVRIPKSDELMNDQAILCATDLSPFGDQALQYALLLAHEISARLVILHVLAPGDGEAAAPRNRLSSVAAGTNVRCQRILRSGNPVDEIVKLADEEHVSRIIIGTHGRPEHRRLALGETAAGVVDRARCPVTVVRNDGLDQPVAVFDYAQVLPALRNALPASE